MSKELNDNIQLSSDGFKCCECYAEAKYKVKLEPEKKDHESVWFHYCEKCVKQPKLLI